MNKGLAGFRDRRIAEKITAKIRATAEGMGPVRLMHVCGTHEDAIAKAGIRSLLPDDVEIISGPGCPVCVTTAREIDEAIALAKEGATVTSFGDMLKVPGSALTLADAKAAGSDVRIVYSITDAVKLAKEKPGKEVVHIGIGFETTAPSSAVELLTAPENFYVLSCHRTIPPAMDYLLSEGDTKIDGFIDPGHVSAIIGITPYRALCGKYGIPQVVAGFEPVDVLYGVLMLLKMIKQKDHGVRNEYSRVVKEEGNRKALDVLEKVFVPCDVKWRGFPVIPGSGLAIRDEYKDHDARVKFQIDVKESPEPGGCICGKILKGIAYPASCPLFGKRCTPDSPVGPCMVSGEGSCNISYKYGRK
ncbi:MAG: hydrogenase formation protein HypD [Candidatus Altiarchaeia archaeon]